MYWDLIEATLKQVRGKARELMGMLTGNEMQEIKGRCEYVLAKVEKRISLEKQASRDLRANLVY